MKGRKEGRDRRKERVSMERNEWAETWDGSISRKEGREEGY